MQDFAAKDKNVRVLLTKERLADINGDFDDVDISDDADADTNDTAWMEGLDYDRKGTIKSTAKNIIAILENDSRLKGHIFHDLFSDSDIFFKGMIGSVNHD